MLRTIFAWAVLLGVLFTAGLGAAETQRATVRGAVAVNVRQEPSADSRALLALPRGAQVTVEGTAGDWAQVSLDDGRRGYIRMPYLELAAVPAADVATPATDPVPETTPAGEAATTPPAVADDELERLRERLAALEAAVAASPVPTATHIPVGGAAHAPIPAAPINGVVTPPATLDVGPALALAAVGLVVGFAFGTYYGHRQERRRRSRVRL